MPDSQREKIITRFKQVREKLGLMQIPFAEKAKLKQSQVSAVESGKRNITSAIKIALEDNLNVNRIWLETGVGNMFKDDADNSTTEQKEKATKKDDIPMYDSPSTASDVEVYDDLSLEGPAFYVNIPQFKDCSFGKKVYGHSMYPTIESGTYVFCKPVSDKYSIIPGEVYYIEYDNFGVCKRLQHSENKSEYIAESDNDEVRKDGNRKYRSFAIPIERIRTIFLIKGHFKQSQN